MWIWVFWHRLISNSKTEKNGDKCQVNFYIYLLPRPSLDSNLPFWGICLKVFVPKRIQGVQYVGYGCFPEIQLYYLKLCINEFFILPTCSFSHFGSLYRNCQHVPLSHLYWACQMHVIKLWLQGKYTDFILTGKKLYADILLQALPPKFCFSF